MTSDEVLYKISEVKSKVLYGLLNLLKRGAIDCNFNEMDNRASGDDLECYNFIEGTTDEYGSTLNILGDERDEQKRKRIVKRKEKEIVAQFPIKTKGGKKLSARYIIKLERGDEDLNISELEDIRFIYNFYKKDRVPIGFVFKGRHTFIKREFMLKHAAGKIKNRDFVDERRVKKMRLNNQEIGDLLKPWVMAEARRKNTK